jgi:hypothetical protein
MSMQTPISVASNPSDFELANFLIHVLCIYCSISLLSSLTLEEAQKLKVFETVHFQ